MTYSRRNLLTLVAILLCVAPLSLRPQTSASPNDSEIDQLAKRTADRAAKTHAHRILVLTAPGCLLDPSICGSLDQKLRAEIPLRIPAAQLFGRVDILPLLANHGLVPVDTYTSAVDLAAPDLGAEIIVSESLKWLENGYEARTTVRDLAKGKNLDDFEVKLARADSDSSTEPLIFREPADGPALVIPRGQGNIFHTHWFPSCEKCPEPKYTDEARAKKIEGIVVLIITVTEQGVAEHIAVVKGLPGGLTGAAVEAVRGWRFKPAVGPDGKPLATRTPVEVNFRLLNR